MLYPSTRPDEDHPRSRGEYTGWQGVRHITIGSSPLSRGILIPFVTRDLLQGIIPALAGNTLDALRRVAHDGDHPRSRGEYEGREKSVIAGVGSSPLSRGIPRVPQIAAGRVRIIPALAGNTQGARCYLCSRGDHPRSRGEYAQAEVNSSFCPGSSPLSRGIPQQTIHRGLLERIIPALAGNTM